MELGRIGNQISEFQKSTFDDTSNAMVMFQDQSEKMFNTFLEQAAWIPEEGKRMIDEWVIAYKKGREDFKNAVDENFKRVEDLFAVIEKSGEVKPEKAPQVEPEKAAKPKPGRAPKA